MAEPSTAVCFRCGSAKPRALDVCASCGSGPRTKRDYLVSTALSPFLSSREELAAYRDEVLAGKPPSVPHEVFLRAIEALKDPAALSVLRSRPLGATRSTAQAPGAQAPAGRQPAAYAPTARPASEAARPATPPVPAAPAAPEAAERFEAPDAHPGPPMPRGAPKSLVESPFAILGATTHDSRRRIGELAQARLRDIGEDASREARTALTHPNSRLVSEIEWLPGIAPADAARLLDEVQRNPLAIREEPVLATLAHLNLLATALRAIDGAARPEALAALVRDLGSLVGQLDAQVVFDEINADRAASGFAPLPAPETVQPELDQRSRYYVDTIDEKLESLPSATLVRVMTDIADGATASGQRRAPDFLEALVDRFEAEAAHGFLPAEAQNITRLVDEITITAASRPEELAAQLEALDIVVANWNGVARPIQLNATARGLDHGASRQLADEIRRLGIHLFNEHGLLAPALRIMDLLRRHFAAVPAIAERAARDRIALEGLARERDQHAAR